MKFETPYSRFDENYRQIYTCSGERYVDDYVGDLDRNGNLTLKKVGKTDLYEQIQSYADSCDMKLIVSRYMSGDMTALNRVQGIYTDITDMPTNLHEALELIDKAHTDFFTLPLEIRQKFDNSVDNFISEFGTPDFYDKLKITVPENNSENEVIANE